MAFCSDRFRLIFHSDNFINRMQWVTQIALLLYKNQTESGVGIKQTLESRTITVISNRDTCLFIRENKHVPCHLQTCNKRENKNFKSNWYKLNSWKNSISIFEQSCIYGKKHSNIPSSNMQKERIITPSPTGTN